MRTAPRITLTLLALLFAGAVGLLLVGQARESSHADAMAEGLIRDAARPASIFVDFAVLADLPPPVARYFRYALTDGQPMIRKARMRQSGVLRTAMTSETWLSFSADHLIVPPATGFLWNARVVLPLAMHLRVLDGYVAGEGSGRVTFMSAFAAATESGLPELDAGALHRYLAEAVWAPTALLPQAGVVWTPIDERSALATLSNRGTTVSLEFRFGDDGAVTGIYTPARFGHFDGAYREAPWEGHFRDYILHSGMRVPRHGEVGWYDNGELRLVWEGSVIDLHYEFER